MTTGPEPLAVGVAAERIKAYAASLARRASALERVEPDQVSQEERRALDRVVGLLEEALEIIGTEEPA